jgi:hypothetical protein
MEGELIASLEGADIPAALKAALGDLAHEAELLLPGLPALQGRRTRYRVERVVTEAIDPTADVHWWAGRFHVAVHGAIGNHGCAQPTWRRHCERNPARLSPDGAKQSLTSAEIASSLTPLLAMTTA